MSITKSNCALCSRIDVLYKFNSTTHIQNAFASVNNNLFQKESIDKIQLCIICTYRVELSSEIMSKFEEMCGRNNTRANKNCSFCEDKTGRLIDINENPNDVKNKIAVFLNSAKTKYDIKDLKSCLKCLYNLSIWFEVRTDVFNIMTISESRTGENSKTKASNTNVVDGSPKASRRTLRKSARNSTQNELENSTVTIDLTKNNVDIEGMQTPKRVRRTRKQKMSNDTTKMSWYKYLNSKLKNLQTVDKIIEHENITVNLPETETDKSKLFHFLPFVEIFVSSQISEDRILENESTEIPTIIVSDAENETPVRRGGRGKSFTQKNATPKAKRTKSPATLKIKFSFPMKSKPLSKYSPAVMANLEKENSPESEEIMNVIDGESDSVNNFVCDTCDKNFNGKCEFLVHRLKHEKKDNVVVNVLRQNLPQTLNILQLSPKKELSKAAVSPEVINRLLTKWIGAHAAKTYIETDNVSDKRSDNENELETESNEGRETLADDNKDEECEKSKDEVESTHDDTFDKEVNETTTVDVIKDSKDPEGQNDNEETSEKDKDEEGIDTERNKIDVNKNNTDLSVVCDKQDERVDRNGEIETEDTQEKKDAELETNDKDALESEANTTDLIGDSDNEVVEYVKENTSTKDSDKEEECNNEDKCEDKTSTGKTDTEQSGNSDGPCVEEVGDTSVDFQLRVNSDEEVGSKKINEDKIPEVRDTCEDVKSQNDQCTSNLEIENCKNGDTTSPDSVVENVNNPPLSNNENDNSENFDDFSNSDLVSPSVMTCEDLLNILETNIESEIDPNHDTSLAETTKRKRDAESEEEPTPKRKRVRFADEKEIFSPDKSGVLLEKIIEDDHILTEDELNEKES